jgi:glycosyltransferase involved in cell wall biosynthesis
MVRCSVLLPVYNGSAFIKKTIQSILDQAYANYEIVIVDDGSTDDSCKVIKDLLGSDFRIIVNERNLGVGRTLRKAFNAAQGEFIAMIGQDDIWEKNYLQNQVEYLENNECLVSFSDVDYIDAHENFIKYQLFQHELLEKINSDRLFLELIKGNFLCAPASVFRVEKPKKFEYAHLWGYNNDRLQDYELWLNLIIRGKFGYNQTTTCHYRLHSKSYSSIDKGIFQEGFEFYSAIRDVLFSERFLKYISSMESVDVFLDPLLRNLEYDIPHAKVMEILIIDFCEYLLNKGVGSESLLGVVLADHYNNLGILSKAKRTAGYLPRRIKISTLYCKNRAVLKGLKRNPNFELINRADSDEKRLFVIDEQNYETAINAPDVLRSLPKKGMIVVCESDQIRLTEKKYPDALVLRGDAFTSGEENRIISFVEDKTDLYDNSLLFKVADESSQNKVVSRLGFSFRNILLVLLPANSWRRKFAKQIYNTFVRKVP